MLQYLTNIVMKRNNLKFTKACWLMEWYLVPLFNKEIINNVFMLWSVIVMSMLFKILMKILLFLIHFLKISLLDRVINNFFMAYLLILIFHLIKNISLIFSQKLSAVMSQHIIVMDLNHTDIEKENRKD